VALKVDREVVFSGGNWTVRELAREQSTKSNQPE
jgi:hypothetical protein